MRFQFKTLTLLEGVTKYLLTLLNCHILSMYDSYSPLPITFDIRCDRILWIGRGIKQLSYTSTEERFSDHRPVCSVFSVEVEVFNHRKLQRALNFTNAAVHPEIFPDEDGDF